jgi:hypothetical protein
MKSPFPGIDPFLEQAAYWRDFHANFVNYWREAIADVLPPHYAATLGERVYLEGLRETDIEILHRPDHSPVTTLELSSPANKEPPGRVEYLAKRRALLLQKIH